MLGDPQAGASQHESGRGGHIERSCRVTAGPGSVEQHLAIGASEGGDLLAAGPHPHDFLPHDLGKPDELLNGLALHTQGGQEGGDLRVGGRYRIGFKTEDGEQHEVGGTYHEVVPDRRLVFSWAWHTTPERSSLVSITLAQDGDEGTLLTLQHERFFDEKARDNHERGWLGTLQKLEDYLG